jgi:hypothetical protein
LDQDGGIVAAAGEEVAGRCQLGHGRSGVAGW